MATGFSQTTCFPWSSASRQSSAWLERRRQHDDDVDIGRRDFLRRLDQVRAGAASEHVRPGLPAPGADRPFAREPARDEAVEHLQVRPEDAAGADEADPLGTVRHGRARGRARASRSRRAPRGSGLRCRSASSRRRAPYPRRRSASARQPYAPVGEDVVDRVVECRRFLEPAQAHGLDRHATLDRFRRREVGGPVLDVEEERVFGEESSECRRIAGDEGVRPGVSKLGRRPFRRQGRPPPEGRASSRRRPSGSRP